MRLVLFDGAIGVLLLAAIIFAGRRRRPARSDSVRRTGWLLVAAPLPVAVGSHLVASLPQEMDQAAFLAGVILFAIGAALILGKNEEEDWNHDGVGDETPPWWPAFERELREYEKGTHARPKALQP
jgi:small neutral amino acid transporter SnatA (MarC family)